MRLLLMSNSRTEGRPYLDHAKPAIRECLGAIDCALFVPYAAVTTPWDDYTALVREALADLGVTVDGVHRAPDPIRAVAEAPAVLVGGGNTWRLVREVHRRGLTDLVRRAVRGGAPYVGWSAGANLACPTFQTTNDMPICDPLGFDALGLVPFQINPHYFDGHPAGFQGETREARILEYLALHPDVWVVGLREGTMLGVRDGAIRLIGPARCRVFRRGEPIRELGAADDVGFLLRP